MAQEIKKQRDQRDQCENVKLYSSCSLMFLLPFVFFGCSFVMRSAIRTSSLAVPELCMFQPGSAQFWINRSRMGVNKTI